VENKFLLKNLTLIIPTFNDDERIISNINKIVYFLDTHIRNYEVIIVSNGSSLKSICQLDSVVSKHKYLKHFILKKSGKGLAIREGINESKYHNILFIDADCSVEIEELEKFINNESFVSPFVIGNRRSSQSQNFNSPFFRKVSGYFYIKFINFLFNINIEDSQCGFKAINKNIFKNCDQFKSDGFSFDLELILLAKICNIQITQVPVDYNHNQNSKVSVFRDSAEMIYEAFKIKKLYKSFF